MKKISLITILDNANFGTYLQTIALCHKMKQIGCCTEVIDYKRKTRTLRGRLFILKSKTRIKQLLKIVEERIAIIHLHAYLKKNVILTTKSYNSNEKLKRFTPQADVYMTGSDQVWNSNHNRGIEYAYYLDFAPEGKPKYAYAASFGIKEIPKSEIAITTSLLNRYNAISVREISAIDLIKKINVKTKVQHVLDPTLLLDIDEWSSFITKRAYNKPYLLVYTVESKVQNKIVNDVAKRIAKQNNLDIVCVTSMINVRGITFDKIFRFAGIQTFLSLFKYADFIVASSFHATAFSINFNKQFYSVTPDRFSSRIQSLLSLCNLQERQINDISQVHLSKAIAYDKVNSILEHHRTVSMKFLNEALRENS